MKKNNTLTTRSHQTAKSISELAIISVRLKASAQTRGNAGHYTETKGIGRWGM